MISIKNINKWYGDFQVLTDCSTEVKKGEVVVVCGPSGSGKSTLIYFTLNMSLMLLMRLVEKKVSVPGLISVGGK